MFQNGYVDHDRAETRAGPIDSNAISQRSATLIQGTNGRTALQLLSQSKALTRATSLPNVKHTSPKTPEWNPDLIARDSDPLMALDGDPIARNPDPIARNPNPIAGDHDPVSKGRDGTFWCRSVECTGGALISEPVDRCSLGRQTCPPPRPRRVAAPANCHLYRNAPSQSLVGDDMMSTNSSVDCRAAPVLLEAPRGWMLGDNVTEGQGRWVSDDGLVYAPLFCAHTGCRSVYVGEKAIAAGLGGEDMVGRSWFFAAVVEANGVGEKGSPRELVLPARLAATHQPSPPRLM